MLQSARAAEPELTLWYRQPAQKWEEALPLGNGRFGVMVLGGVQREGIGLSEGTLWLGKPEFVRLVALGRIESSLTEPQPQSVG